ncbi:MAG: hypothetical protein EXX96DRAFT_490082 [Benjaminiella poitrasii]|nr:MAG: hypothetical protein EXX96DRAFT_490082 [Benjaminiella poitrasii]
MVSVKSFLTSSFVTLLATQFANAAIAPTYPSPGVIQTEGQSYDISWNFMTGSNDQQTVLMSVAKNVSADLLKYPFVAPQVTPHSAIYFFMFTGSNGETSWTTRFGIIAPGGTLSAEPEQVEPNGDAIPWGNGALASGTSSSNNTVINTATPVATTVAAATTTPTANTNDTIVTPNNVNVTNSTVDDSGVATVNPGATTSSVTKVVAEKDSAESAAVVIKPLLTSITLVAAAAYFAL